MSLDNETLAYLSGFNTDPACAGVGVTNVAREPIIGVALGIYITVATIMIASSFWFIYMRRYRRRLRIRSLQPIVLGSIGSAIIIIIRAGYNFVGREHLPCDANLTMMYLFWVLNLVPDNLQVTSYMVKQKYRHYISTFGVINDNMHHRHPNSAHADKKKVARDTSLRLEGPTNISGPESAAMSTGDSSTFIAGISPIKWTKGFWNYFLTLEEAVQFQYGTKIKFHSKWRFDDEQWVSAERELSFDIICTMLYAGSLWLGLGLRVGLVPAYKTASHCTGCTLFWEDIPILFTCLFWLGILQALVLFRTRNISDPLSYRCDLMTLTGITSIAWIGYFLAAFDPNNLMKDQTVDWFLFECLAAFVLHCHRCFLQMYRVSRLHKLGEQQIKLIDLLQDSKSALLFEKYLMGELASENLLFWREGVKYKYNFDRNKDFDYSQQVAKILYRTFISKHAQLPINISGPLRDKIETHFKSGYVGKTVFDDALIEVYKMMQNGPFYRFVRSKEFIEYSNSNADFGFIATRGTQTMSIIPAPGDIELDTVMRGSNASGLSGNMSPGSANGHFDVAEYIHTL